MVNNFVFAKLLSIFGLNRDYDKVIALFKEKGIDATKTKINRWRRSPQNSGYGEMPDFILEAFLESLKPHRIELVKGENSH